MKKATIFAIKPYEIHDGDGIRTTVFFKGCPLRCKWCHNPESFQKNPQLSFLAYNCVNCGRCAALCNAHYMENCIHKFNREMCVGCGKCVSICHKSALTLYGYDVTVDELTDIVMEDADFYKNSGGGVTVSGGEPLLQAEFCADFLKKLKDNGINTAVDTCGYVEKSAIERVIPYTDTFLYDLKAIDSEVHKSCCGVSNQKILDNLKYIDSLGKKIEIRIPYVPKMNDNQIEKIGEFICKLKNVTKVRVLKYHNFAIDKYSGLGIKYPGDNIVMPEDKDILAAINQLKSMGINAMSSDE